MFIDRNFQALYEYIVISLSDVKKNYYHYIVYILFTKSTALKIMHAIVLHTYHLAI